MQRVENAKMCLTPLSDPPPESMPSPSPERNLAQALQEGRCRDPFSHLGPHQDGAAGDWVIRAFLPGATIVTALASFATCATRSKSPIQIRNDMPDSPLTDCWRQH